MQNLELWIMCFSQSMLVAQFYLFHKRLKQIEEHFINFGVSVHEVIKEIDDEAYPVFTKPKAKKNVVRTPEQKLKMSQAAKTRHERRRSEKNKAPDLSRSERPILLT